MERRFRGVRVGGQTVGSGFIIYELSILGQNADKRRTVTVGRDPPLM
jgi:hypothetical protein